MLHEGAEGEREEKGDGGGGSKGNGKDKVGRLCCLSSQMMLI